ncbi:MAG: DUF5683 domain-containing protein [bacterium]
MIRILFILLFSFFVANSSVAQFRDSSKKKNADTSHFQMQRSPTVALVLSGIVPGAGQIYTGGWYKAPFLLGAIVGCFYAASVQNGRYQADVDSVKNQTARGDTFRASLYTNQREFYHDDRDKWYIYAGLFYMANLIDAYISAHLFDFDVSEPQGAYISPPANHHEPWRLAVQFSF